MVKKIIGVTVGTTMNPKKISGNMTAHEHSWNDLTEKPFYEIPGKETAVTFNGDISTADVVCESDEDRDGISDSFVIKLSGDAPEPSDFIGGKLSIVQQGVETEIIVTEEVLQGEGFITDLATSSSLISGSGYYLGGSFVVFTEDGKMDMPYADESREVSFSKGIYGMYASIPNIGTVYTSKISYNVPEQVKQLDMKFIPDELKTHYEIPGEEVTVTFDGDITGKETFGDRSDDDKILCLVKVSDLTPDVSELVGVVVVETRAGEDYTGVLTEETLNDMYSSIGSLTPFTGNYGDEYGYFLGDAMLVVKKTITEEGVTLNTGMWFTYDSSSQTYVKSLKYDTPSTIKQLDEKFIPDTICRKEYVEQLLGASVDDIASLIGGDA